MYLQNVFSFARIIFYTFTYLPEVQYMHLIYEGVIRYKKLIMEVVNIVKK